MITEFNGEFDFLSNFYTCKVEHRTIVNSKSVIEFTSAEHAYQAAKATNNADRLIICNARSAGEAKRLGNKIELRKDWERLKFDFMYEIVLDKFTRNISIQEELMQTKNQILKEGNWWHDNIWGQCTCPSCYGKGQNHLGLIIMRIRRELRNI